ncbi:phosphonate C-P lyase system protein PhnH [Paracoccus sp. S-4012]|uniref:phosphonate C-P lyase system protein PhnH n=1 Tax=Paracoccus sp. S-4012 TaxID=2665648 RepID=UPI0012AEF5F8|nr:phosphonate C-P lyase system protein PhnH [Paracoccus sp. S-4012]MRX52115.1 phosphonate C-P lyase system protein PhnH [Paracoccus sp. S-4012]
MTVHLLSGGFADPPTDAAHAFRAVMQAMARPGTIHRVAGAQPPVPLSSAAAIVLLTLCDRTTPLHLAPSHDTEAVRGWITFHCGAPFVPAQDAAFALGTWEALTPADRFAIGDPEYPDRAATLIVERPALAPQGAALTGPGIRDTAGLSLPDPEAFAANHRRFPLGWDAILTCGDQLAAVPRSTEVR